MSTQYTFNSKTQSGTITIDNRFITIQSSNFLFGIFRIRNQNQTLPLQTLSLVSSGLRYLRNSIFSTTICTNHHSGTTNSSIRDFTNHQPYAMFRSNNLFSLSCSHIRAFLLKF